MPCSSPPSSRLHSTLQELEVQIDDAALNAWKNDQLEDAEALLTNAIHQHQHPRYHFLAARALVRARLQHWDDAFVDAQMVPLALRSHPLTLTASPQGHRCSTIQHCLHRKKSSLCRQGRKG